MNLQKKYLKYKLKYFELQNKLKNNNLKAGMDEEVDNIHQTPERNTTNQRSANNLVPPSLQSPPSLVPPSLQTPPSLVPPSLQSPPSLVPPSLQPPIFDSPDSLSPIPEILTPPNPLYYVRNNLFRQFEEINEENFSYNHNFEFKLKFGSRGSGDGQFIKLQDVIMLKDGNICALDSGKKEIQIFDESGNFISKFGSNEQFDNPMSIIQLSNNNIVVLDLGKESIDVFDYTNNFNKINIGDVNNKYSPVKIINLNNNNLAIIDGKTKNIKILDESFNLISEITSDGMEINKPNNILQLSNGNIVVSDADLGQIKILNLNGNLIKKCNSKLSIPNNIINLTDDLFGVFYKYDVYIYDIDGNYLEIFDLTYKFKINDVKYINKLKNNTFCIVDNKFDSIRIYELKYIETVDIQTVLTNINYSPWETQPQIIFDYLLDTDKNVNFDYKCVIDFYSNDISVDNKILNNATIIYDLFEVLFENKNIILMNNLKPSFVFRNIITKKKDSGIDAGALTKTIFTYLSLNLSKSKYFKMDSDNKMFKLNTFDDKSLDKNLENKINFIGQLFGLAIKLKLTIQISLDPILLYQLTNDIDVEKITKDDIIKIINDYDEKMLDDLPFLCFDVDENTNKTSTPYISCFYNSEGIPVELSNVNEETVNKIKNEIIEKKKVTEIFVKGFRSQINIKKSQINKLPLKQLDILIAGIKVKDLATLLKNLNFINFNQQRKNILIKILENHICANIHSEYIGSLLMVMTGSNRIPANGYPISNKLRFEIVDKISNNFPIEVHACFNQFIINERLFKEYEDLLKDEKNNIKNTELYTTFSQESLKNMKTLFNIA
jgi:hypothetical protein